ncbi:hypothetical protein BC826DRAFT_1108263 [Russula brevipes]|nr:hypothetical protein BC826DRAFT_1108263 [Russula brevipes]
MAYGPGKLELPLVENEPLGISLGNKTENPVKSTEGMLRSQLGTHPVKVALLAERGVVDFDPQQWDAEKIIKVSPDATLIPPVRSDEITLRIYGMTCSSCTSTVETELGKMPGTMGVAVSFATETVKVSFDRGLIGPREMVERVEELGFDAILSDQQDATLQHSLTRTKEIQEWRLRFQWSVAFALPVFLIGMVAPHIPFLRDICHFNIMPGIPLCHLVIAIITTPAQSWIGQKFYRNTYKTLKHKTATMDVLVMLVTSAAYFYSFFVLIVAAFKPDPENPRWFSSIPALIMFVSLGRFLENSAKRKTSAALTDLMALTPSMAIVYMDAICTQEKKIPTELQIGDTVKVVLGDKDGLGVFDMVVTRAGRTPLAQIVKLVEDAQSSKAPIQAFADRVAGYFVPAVISLAAVTFVGWMLISSVAADTQLPEMFHHRGTSKLALSLSHARAHLVLAPHRDHGRHRRGREECDSHQGRPSLEDSRGLKRVVLDKTGTVTEGKLTVAGLAWAPTSELEETQSYGAAELTAQR